MAFGTLPLPPALLIIAKYMTNCSAWKKSLLEAVRLGHWASVRKYLVPNGFVWPVFTGAAESAILWLKPKSIKTNSTSANVRMTPPELPVKRRHMTFLGERSPWYHPALCSS